MHTNHFISITEYAYLCLDDTNSFKLKLDTRTHTRVLSSLKKPVRVSEKEIIYFLNLISLSCHPKEKLFCAESGNSSTSGGELDTTTLAIPSRGTERYRAEVPSGTEQYQATFISTTIACHSLGNAKWTTLEKILKGWRVTPWPSSTSPASGKLAISMTIDFLSWKPFVPFLLLQYPLHLLPGMLPFEYFLLLTWKPRGFYSKLLSGFLLLRKMFDAILQILRDGLSLELAVASFQLLTDLDKRYPRVYVRESDNLGTNSGGAGELVVNKEAWSPFTVRSGNSHVEASGICRDSKSLLDSASFSILVEEIAIGRHSAIKTVQNMLLFQYLVRALEADFLPRHTLYKETLNWVFLRESVLSLLVASRKMNYKSLVHNCMSVVSTRFIHEANICHKDLKDKESISGDLPQSCNVGLPFAFPEIQRKACDAVQKLLILIMELDVIRKEAESLGLTSRSDSFRATILDTILDELTYNKDQLSRSSCSFEVLVNNALEWKSMIFMICLLRLRLLANRKLAVFEEPKWKLEIILLYFGKYYSRPSTRTRRSNSSPNDETFEGILNCFSNPTTTGGILRKMATEVACLLLAQAFKCYLSLQRDQKNAVFVTEKIGGSTLPEICNSLVTAFKNLRKLDHSLELTSFEKQALTTAAALVSLKS
ncbi:hypothetical protein IEQ34_011852 [Dendrobium chrysotoxum]|uniref:Uncharacterized protein n=1 Tax=Dendrobium chrysotoxum TaxID=161865 RepID=A0AAV7GTH4_DENCH|nr:hypothetical protein IEQ34_011852 [Dendrobium chrysotoxum]